MPGPVILVNVIASFLPMAPMAPSNGSDRPLTESFLPCGGTDLDTPDAVAASPDGYCDRIAATSAATFSTGMSPGMSWEGARMRPPPRPT